MESSILVLGEVVTICLICWGSGIILIPMLIRKFLPPFEETYLSDFLPFQKVLEDQKTLGCRDGSLCRIFEIKGVDLKTATTEEKIFFEMKLKFFFECMAERGGMFRFFTQREKISIKDSINFNNPILQKIHEQWSQEFEACYRTKNYLFIQALHGKDMEDLSSLVFDHLSLFKPSILENRDSKNSQQRSSLLSFLSGLVNPKEHAMPIHTDNISQMLTHSEVNFNLKEGLVEVKEGSEVFFYAVLGVRGWGEKSSSEILRELLLLPLEFEILHHCRGLKSIDGRTTLRYRLSQENLIFKNFFKKEEFEKAIDNLEAGKNSLYEYQLSFFIKGHSKKEVFDNAGILKKVLLNYGIKPVIECDAIEWLWFSRFPGYDQLVRPRNLFSNNLGVFLNFEENREGMTQSDWGQGPLRYFKTSQGNPYALQLHVGEEKESLAHSLTIAPSSSGKTTLFQHLIGGALRHKDLHAFIFDRFNGTRIFTESLQGSYIDFQTRENFGINPLQCEDTPENRFFLTHFFLKLGRCDNAASLEMVQRAIESLFKVPLCQRSLKTIYKYVFDTGSKLREELLPWAEGEYSEFLNGAIDCLDFKVSRLVSFEMTEILKDPRIASVLVDYILHRIRTQVRRDAAPHLIFIDEAAPMLEDSFFAKQVQTLFREHRKLRGSINICFQDAQALFKLPISEVILNQCPTIFLFQNINARAEDYAPLNLSEFEWKFIKGASSFSKHVKRGVLLKNHQESLVLDVDLGSLGPLLNIYKSGTESIKLMMFLKNMWGEKWIEHYLESF